MAWLIVIVAVLAVLAAGLAVALPRIRTRQLRARFGPEYERALRGHGDDVRGAERELTARIRDDRALQLRPLGPAEQENVRRRLAEVQEQFVDDPGRAAGDAERQLTGLLDRLGYPAQGRTEALSVHHATALPAYRTALGTLERAQAVQVGTEELRHALLAVRDLTLRVLADRQAAPAAAGRPAALHKAPAPRTS
ncbi:hypothetical protein AB0D08_16550 [Kitasatospora sp. NPDC048540]|uniref:hypothetical protein n=1 Tax=unclassified Kitasatospora TaxID=2633591 RepID=UPI00068A17C6|nr:hypothetical protein [Kitasatospora sp. MBT63]